MSAIIFTMAGESRRFREAGIDVPKYRLTVRDRTLFSWSVDSVRAFTSDGWRLVFVGRDSDSGLDEFIKFELADLDVDYELVLAGKPTDGQASTAMLASEAVATSEPIAIFNIDTHITPGAISPEAVRGDGWIPCFDAEGDGWSFLKTDETGLVSEVREKVRISDHCTVGFYGFSSFDLFADAYNRSVQRIGAAEQRERYVAPLYNTLIAGGREVFSHCLPGDSVIPLGTPAEVQAFSESR